VRTLLKFTNLNVAGLLQWQRLSCDVCNA